MPPEQPGTTSTNIVDWFDIHDLDHLSAWSHLCTTGAWPDKFIPDGMEFNTHWQVQIAMCMADAWTSATLSCAFDVP